MKKIHRYVKNAFTLVELLAVIVILAIILVIAVPNVMDVINDSKKAALETSIKLIAGDAEKKKITNKLLNKTEQIKCEDIANLNKDDYKSCDIDFVDNKAFVTIEGSGKFEGLYVCSGTKEEAKVQEEICELSASNIKVNHPLFIKGQSITPDKFKVSVNHNGSERTLWGGGLKADETVEPTIITSPNWPENYPREVNENWEVTYEGADAIQITFDETSQIFTDDSTYYDNYIALYDKEGNKKYKLIRSDFADKTYMVMGDYVKIEMSADHYKIAKGFSATVRPAYNVSSEYTVSPSVAPNSNESFDITITLNEQNISKNISTKVANNISDYIISQNQFDTVERIVEYNGRTYDAGIRYVGEPNTVKNKVYYNCDDKDANGISYGSEGYDYASSCEIWSIIGVFDVSNGKKNEKRVKIINTASLLWTAWDSSGSELSSGYGVNQWGAIGTYEGADLMKLLNGFYINKSGATCKKCYEENQSECPGTCTEDDLKNNNMKVLTNKALQMIEDAVWDTYGVMSQEHDYISSINYANTAYLQEKGISAQYTGISGCANCDDGIPRTTSWKGLVGLMTVSDIAFSNGWLYDDSLAWTITSNPDGGPVRVWYSGRTHPNNSVACGTNYTWPTVYLKSNVKVIGGNGDTEPYKLSLNSGQ